jgi:hypothetical protein
VPFFNGWRPARSVVQNHMFRCPLGVCMGGLSFRGKGCCVYDRAMKGDIKNIKNYKKIKNNTCKVKKNHV